MSEFFKFSKMKFLFVLRKNVTINHDHSDFFKSSETHFHFSKTKLYSIGLNYSLVSSKHLVVCYFENDSWA